MQTLKFLVLLIELWLLAAAILALHRLSLRFGITPLVVLLGGLTMALQSQGIGYPPTRIGNFVFQVDSYVLLPTILLGLLIIYIVNGTAWARGALIGIVAVTVVMVAVQVFSPFNFSFVDSSMQSYPIPTYPTRVLLASVTSLVVDLVVLILVYQFVSNYRKRFPSRVAAIVALVVGLWNDAIIFTLVNQVGQNMFWGELITQLLGKTVAGLALTPLIYIYFNWGVIRYPYSEATMPRPIFDFFASGLGWDAQGQQTIIETAAETMQDGLIISDLKGKIIYANSMAVRTIGRSLSEIIGLNAKSLLPDSQAQHFPNILAQIIENGSISLEFEYPIRNNRVLILAMISSVVKNENGPPQYIVSSFRDVTMQHDQELRFVKLNQLTTKLVQIRELQNLLYSILISSEDFLGANASIIYLMEPDGKAVADVSVHNVSQEYALRIARDYSGLPGEKASITEQPVFIEDTLNDDEFGERIHFMAEYDLRALLILPILYQNNRIGALTVYYHQPHLFQESEIQLGMTLAQTLAILIQNARLYEAEQEQHRLSSALARAAASLNSSLNPDIVLERILEEVMFIVHCRAANIMMFDGEYGCVLQYRGYEDIPGYIDQIDSIKIPASTPNIQAMLQGDTYLVPDVSKDETWVVFPGTEWIKGYVGIPLKFDDEIVGFLNVDCDQPNQVSKKSVFSLLGFASHASIALHNAQLYKIEQEQLELSDALVKAAVALNSSLDPDVVLESILEQVMRIVPCKAANIFLLEEDYAVVAGHRGYDEFPETVQLLNNTKFSIEMMGLDRMLTKGVPVLVPDTKESDLWIDIPESAWVRGYAGIPLEVESDFIGVLNVDTDQPNLFSGQTIVQLLGFAAHAATALQNSRLYASSLRRAEEMSALAAASTTVSASLNLKEVLYIVAEKMSKILNVQVCAISSYDLESNKVTLLAEYMTDVWDIDDDWLAPYDLNPHSLTHQVIEENKPIQVLVKDMPENVHEYEYLTTAGVKSLLMLPLIVKDATIGFVELMDDLTERVFSDNEILLGQTLAANASIAINNARLFESSHRRANEMAAIVTAVSAVSSSLEFKDVLNVVARQMIDTLKVQACAISDYNPEVGTVTLLSEYGPAGWDVEEQWYQPYSLDQYPITQQVIEKQIPIQVNSSSPDVDSAERRFMEEAEIKTLLMLPLVVQDKVIGLVELMDDEVERVFSDDEILLGQTLASHAAIAIQNADLYQRLQEYAEDLETSVQKRTVELMEAKESIEGILASVPDAVFVLDEQGQLIQANQAGEILFERSQKVDKNIFAPEFLEDLISRQSADAQPVVELDDRAYQARSAQILADDEKTARQVIVFQDVTRFRELDQMKSQFITDISHELRTPLTNVTLYLSLLEALNPARNPEKHKTYLDILQRETDRLTHLIEDLLTISRIESHEIGLQLQPIDANHHVEMMFKDRKFLAAQKEIRLEYTLTDDLPYAIADPELLGQALSGLLTNAINYTPPGGSVQLGTGLENRDNRDWVVIRVSDNGFGISQEEIPFIFDRFYRGEASQETGAEGTGLGLAIAKEIVDRMGGDITIESSLGEGSTFSIWLRLATDMMYSSIVG